MIGQIAERLVLLSTWLLDQELVQTTQNANDPGLSMTAGGLKPIVKIAKLCSSRLGACSLFKEAHLEGEPAIGGG